MRTLQLSAQDDVGSVESVIVQTATPGPLIDAPATALWVGVGAFIFIFLLVMFLLIRSRVILPARRKQNATQYFEPAGEDADTDFGDLGPIDTPFEDAAHEEPTPEDEYAPQADDDGDDEHGERWRDRDEPIEEIEVAEPVEEPHQKGAFGSFFGGAPKEEEAPAQPAQNDNDAHEPADDYPNTDYGTEAAPAHPVEDDRDASKIDAAFVQALSSEFAAYRKSTRESIDGLSRRMDALAGASPDSLASLTQEIASLKAFLSDKPAAISTAGRIQLSELVRSILPARQFSFSKTLSTGRKADCLINSSNLPAPFAIDARFPVDAFDEYCRNRDDFSLGEQAANDYRRAVLRHMVDIAENLIVPGETADFAIMFMPAEPIYHDLYASFGDVVQDSYRAKVWILSPTTLMASLHMLSAITAGGKNPEHGTPSDTPSGGNPSGAKRASAKPTSQSKPTGIHDENWTQSESDARIAASLERLQSEQSALEQETQPEQKTGGATASFPLRPND